LSPGNLRKASSGLYIDILEKKTMKSVTVSLADPEVIEILENEFPRKFSQVVFNKQIKVLCKMAGINGLVSGFKNNPKTRRKEIVDAPKYEFIETERSGEQIHNYCNHKESYRQRKIDRIIVSLNRNEIKKLKVLVDLSYELENIRKWFFYWA
jgi:hypothetical protein